MSSLNWVWQVNNINWILENFEKTSFLVSKNFGGHKQALEKFILIDWNKFSTDNMFLIHKVY